MTRITRKILIQFVKFFLKNVVISVPQMISSTEAMLWEEGEGWGKPLTFFFQRRTSKPWHEKPEG